MAFVPVHALEYTSSLDQAQVAQTLKGLGDDLNESEEALSVGDVAKALTAKYRRLKLESEALGKQCFSVGRKIQKALSKGDVVCRECRPLVGSLQMKEKCPSSLARCA